MRPKVLEWSLTKKMKNVITKAAFGSRKSISGKYFIFRKCYFPERKMYSSVWLRRNSFYGKSIPVFGSYKHFTKNDFLLQHQHYQVHSTNISQHYSSTSQQNSTQNSGSITAKSQYQVLHIDPLKHP